MYGRTTQWKRFVLFYIYYIFNFYVKLYEIFLLPIVFEKWEMGEYDWKSYSQVDEMANDFGKGLRELG